MSAPDGQGRFGDIPSSGHVPIAEPERLNGITEMAIRPTTSHQTLISPAAAATWNTTGDSKPSRNSPAVINPAPWPPAGVKPYYADDAVCIILGDCRDILPLLGPVDLVLTDPPYGIGAKYGSNYDDAKEGYWEWFLPTLALMCAAAKTTIFTHRVTSLRMIEGWDDVGVWHKPWSSGTRLGNSPILPHWEPIFMFGIHNVGVNKGHVGNVFTENPERVTSWHERGRDVWAAATEINEHPTPKPVELYRKFISVFTSPTSIVLDPFMGSGTTLRAAKDLGRKAIGIEIEERYCEIAAKRMAQGVLV